MYNNNTNPAYIAADHHKMKHLDHSYPALKVLNIHFSHIVLKNGTSYSRIRKTESLGKFKILLLSFIKVKFRHNFRDTVRRMCDPDS